MPSRLTPRDRRAILLRLVAVLAVGVGAGLALKNPLLGLAAAAVFAVAAMTRPRARQLWRRATGQTPRMSYFID
jgi:hypothetical protein